MQIIFSAPDGQPIPVTDTRRDSVPNKQGKASAFAVPQARRPAGALLTAMRV